ncbi:MAG: sel1 repeat family protein [Rubrivivax sp.]|nr:sel1 repeat family protein [Rubrivivax sp.]
MTAVTGDAAPSAPYALAASAPSAASQELAAAVRLYTQGRFAAAGRVFERLARQGLPAASHNLAVMHLRRELPQASPRRAEALFRQAAEAGFVTAQFALAQGLETGQFGPRDLVQAHDWYERAAQAGSVPAQVAIATAYYLGRGRAHDAGRAAHWYRQAAQGGDEGAMYLIASMYEQGDGVLQDERLARHWYSEAARQGDVAAEAKLKSWRQDGADGPTAPP